MSQSLSRSSHFLLYICLFLIVSKTMAQPTVKELDRQIRKDIKGKLTLVKTGKKIDLLAIYVYKTNNKIFSVMKMEKFGPGKRGDSLLSYQFGYINDTLLRVRYIRATVKDRKNGAITVYLSKNKILAIDRQGDIYLPDLTFLSTKSAELLRLATAFIKNKTAHLTEHHQ